MMGEEHPEARGTTCHQCAALAEELAQAQAELAAAKRDAMRFNALRRIRSFHAGVFLLADPDSGREIVAVPTETICYSVFATGCDERDAVDNAINIMRAEQDAARGATTAPTVETAPGVTP